MKTQGSKISYYLLLWISSSCWLSLKGIEGFSLLKIILLILIYVIPYLPSFQNGVIYLSTVYTLRFTRNKRDTPKMSKKWFSLKDRCLILTIQTEPDFSWACGFREVLDNVGLTTYVKFQKIWMTRCRNMGKKQQKYPKNRFLPICDP